VTRTALIMPTINVPPNLRAWSAQLQPDDIIIIAGSGGTPHANVEALLDTLPQHTVYLHPAAERSTRWRVGEFLPLNDHNRFNLALLEAMTYRPDQVLCLDDDNFPVHDDWLVKATDILAKPNWSKPVIDAENGWFNPGRVCMPQVVHRGYPQWLRYPERDGGRPDFTLRSPGGEHVGVFASLWIGDPDIDATERIVLDPQVREVRNTLVLNTATLAPFDTQSTLVNAALAPLLFMWTEVGRFDDIWASYLCRAYMNANHWHHAFGKPAVRQDRNPHDLVRDLENEVFGYRYNEPITSFMRSLEGGLAGLTPVEGLEFIINAINDDISFLPPRLHEALDAWIIDVLNIEKGTMSWEV
jgi:hypothetical protein